MGPCAYQMREDQYKVVRGCDSGDRDSDDDKAASHQLGPSLHPSGLLCVLHRVIMLIK